MKMSVPNLLTFNGGFVDTAGFLALQGLFTAHVTGNFVTLGASLVHGTSGALAKLLALPVFCVVVVLVRLFSSYIIRSDPLALNALLGLKIVLFVAAAALAIALGPFTNGDSFAAIVTGMTLVAGMAIQNAVHRIFFPKSPPTTLMTGSTTQLMMDIADLMKADLPQATRSAAAARCVTLLRSVLIFAVSCGLAAVVYAQVGMATFVIPPVMAGVTLIAQLRSTAQS